MKKILFPLFFFLILIISPAYAYLDIDINKTYSGGLINHRGTACTNNTGTFYCYLVAENSATHYIMIQQFNETLDLIGTCNSGLTGIAFISGVAIANNSNIMWVQTDRTARLIDITNVSGGTCSPSLQFGTMNQTNSLVGGGYYNIDNNNASAWIYWGYDSGGVDNGIRNSTTNDYISLGFWGSTSYSLKLPNQTNNTTVYAYYDDLFIKYINGVFDSFSAQPSITWGFTPGTNAWDVWQIDDSTTWLYVTGSSLYRVNLTEAETLGDTYITAIEPIGGETITDSTPNLHAIVYSANNGTVGWYVDGAFKSNQSVTTDGVSADVYYTVTPELTAGSHTWKAYFYPNDTYSFDTGTQTFIIGLADNIITDGAEALSGLIGGFFGVTEQSIANAFFSIIGSFIAGMISAYFVRKEAELVGKAFLFGSILALTGFTIIGWFPIIFFILIAGLMLLTITGVMARLFGG